MLGTLIDRGLSVKFIGIRACALRAAVLTGALIMVFALPRLTFAAEMVSVGNAWARATAPGQKTAGAYMELTSEVDAALVAVASPAAGKTELHTMSMDGGVMRMRPVAKIDLPAKKAVKLAPGGLHVMLLDIRQPLKEGDKVPLTLTIRGGGNAQSTIKVEAQVRAAGSASMHHGH